MIIRSDGLTLAHLYSGLGSTGTGIASSLSAGSLASRGIASNTALALALGGAPAACFRLQAHTRRRR
tara:strand:- start:115 stop:315 length:201 start_codon:yes stop_codon:yes gene_type:complete